MTLRENLLNMTQKNQQLKLKNNPEDLQKGLTKLVLIVVEILRQVLERQAKRKVEANELSDEEIERLGIAFSRIKSKLDYITNQFDIEKSEIEKGLSSMLVSDDAINNTTIADLLDKVIEKNAVIAGNISISVADIDLIVINLLASISTNTKTINEKQDK